MFLRHIVSASLIILFALSNSFPQNVPTDVQNEKKKELEEKKKELENQAVQLLEQAVSDAGLLKLADNRALVYSMAGDLIWKTDEKRGRRFYLDAADNLVAAVNAPVENPSNQQITSIFGRQDIYNLRRMVLMSLVKHDSAWAMDLLIRSRPADLAEAMANAAVQTQSQPAEKSAPKPRIDPRVDMELRLEQSILAQAAADDPQKGAKTIRDLMAKGFSFEIVQLLQKMVQKDEKLANGVANEVIQKLLSADLTANRNDLNFAGQFLRFNSGSQPTAPNAKEVARIKIEPAELKALAGKIADTLMKSTNFADSFQFDISLPILQKFIPERVAALKKKQESLKKQMPANSFNIGSFPSSISNPDATPEQLIADAAKAQPQFRSALYRQAANKSLGAGGNPEKVRAALKNQPAGKERDEAISFLDTRLADRQIAAGKLDEARKIIDGMPIGNDKVAQIVKMAVNSYRLNTKESKETANSLMEEARQMVKDFPEDKDETDGLLTVIGGFALIEPARAFAMLSPVIDQTNDLINASATLAKYNKQNQVFRDGEIVMVNNFASLSGKIFSYGREIKMLAQADFTRTRGLIDQFRRDDVKVFTKIFIAQSILNERPRMQGGGIIMSGGSF